MSETDSAENTIRGLMEIIKEKDADIRDLEWNIYRPLKKGEMTKVGDHVLLPMEDAKWEEVSGEHLRPAPDPCYPAHCIYRRHIAKEQTEQIAALTAERDLANEERAVLCKDCNRHEAFDENVKLLAEVERLQKEYRELNTFFQDVRRSLTDTGIELIEENTTLHQRCEMLEEALKEIADNRGISTGNLREITQQALAEGNVIDRTHEECVECSLEKRNPPECNGHVAGPSACSKFNALKDGKEKE